MLPATAAADASGVSLAEELSAPPPRKPLVSPGMVERLEILSQKDGAFKCRTAFNCTAACPRGIKVTKAIQEVKQAALFQSF